MGGPTLRAWQRQALLYLLNRGHRKLLQAPTGSGKSLVLRQYAYHRIAEGRRVVLAVPSLEIARQFRSAVLAESALRPGWDLDGQACYLPAHELVITSHATFWRRVDAYDPGRWEVIFDEAHHGNEEAPVNAAALERFPRVLGASASPWTPRCVELFGRRPFVYRLSQAIADGCVSPYRVHVGRPLPVEIEGKTIRFVGSLRQVEAGGGVHSKMDAGRRRRRVATFAHMGESIAAKRCLLEGFDVPDLVNVVIEVNSRSVVALYQMMGRALRFQIGKIANIWISEISHKYLLTALRKAQ